MSKNPKKIELPICSLCSLLSFLLCTFDCLRIVISMFETYGIIAHLKCIFSCFPTIYHSKQLRWGLSTKSHFENCNLWFPVAMAFYTRYFGLLVYYAFCWQCDAVPYMNVVKLISAGWPLWTCNVSICTFVILIWDSGRRYCDFSYKIRCLDSP